MQLSATFNFQLSNIEEIDDLKAWQYEKKNL